MIEKYAEFLTHNLFRVKPDSLFGHTLSFFIYDTIKIFLLLIVIIFLISIIRTYLPAEKIRIILSRKYKFVGNILAALLGIITPFCTCSAIPLFLGFVQAGVPLGVTFSFLIASPMINEVALILLAGMFGLKIALLYILSGLLIAIISGLIIGNLKVENLVADFVYKTKNTSEQKEQKLTFRDRVKYSKKYTINIIKKVYIFVLIGIALGAFIHGYVPTDFLANYAGRDKWYAVPLATLIGIPLYSNAAGVVPLVSVLTEKGVAMGTTLAFMMAVTGLSLPEFMILKKIMKPKLIIIFAVIVGLGIIFTGYLFNLILR